MESSSYSKHFLTTFFSLVALLSNDFITLNSAARVALPKTNTEFIKTSCGATTYPKLCFDSLSTHASSIQTSPKLIAGAALNVTLFSTKSTCYMMLKLSQSHDLKPKEVAAMRDCLEEFSDSVYELSRSIGEMNEFKESDDFGLMISDIQTWVSAALTDESTCMDGFEGNGMNGNLKTLVKSRIVNIAHLTSNALALINRYALCHA